LDVSELIIIKNNVTKYSGTIEDYLKGKGFKEVKKCTSTIVERFPHMHTMEANVVVNLDNCDCSF
jgi:hypothetical protein